jgi:hypothetical protein
MSGYVLNLLILDILHKGQEADHDLVYFDCVRQYRYYLHDPAAQYQEVSDQSCRGTDKLDS